MRYRGRMTSAVLAVPVERRLGPGGRPSIYTDDLAERICREIATGRTLQEVSRDEWAPDQATIYRWRLSRPEFCESLARAREAGAEVLADSCISLVDAVDTDSPFGAARVSKAREQVGVRRWLAACNNPRYSDRLQVDATTRSLVVVAFTRLGGKSEGE